jgi:hypothetical protein
MIYTFYKAREPGRRTLAEPTVANWRSAPAPPSKPASSWFFLDSVVSTAADGLNPRPMEGPTSRME